MKTLHSLKPTQVEIFTSEQKQFIARFRTSFPSVRSLIFNRQARTFKYVEILGPDYTLSEPWPLERFMAHWNYLWSHAPSEFRPDMVTIE